MDVSVGGTLNSCGDNRNRYPKRQTQNDKRFVRDCFFNLTLSFIILIPELPVLSSREHSILVTCRVHVKKR